MTGPERQDLALAIQLIRDLRDETNVRFDALEDRLRKREDFDTARDAAEKVQIGVRLRGTVTRRWVITTAVAALGSMGGVIALLAVVAKIIGF